MIFASYEFVFLFLPVTLLGYFALSKAKSRIPQHIFLLAASLFFYGYFSWKYLALIVASVSVNYLAAAGMGRARGRRKLRRALFAAQVVFDLGLLGFFKYYDFFAETVNSVFRSDLRLLHILLPLGISFFTIQQLAFAADVYRDKATAPDFLSYCLFVTFFPQLIAGPIVLSGEMLPQLADEKKRRFSWDNFSPGFLLFVTGMGKKLLIADTVSVIADSGYRIGGLGFEAAWLVSLAYTVQIYFDFSGYSDMAAGLAKMFNFDLPVNFDAPYRSASLTDFWRRWHITLGRSLSSLVYIPLGGSRKGLARTCLNLMAVFLVSGAWHGADWTFILWGAVNGLIVAAERLTGFGRREFRSKSGMLARRAATFLTVNFLWVLFRAESIGQAAGMIGSMLNPMKHDLSQLRLLGGNIALIYGVAAGAIALAAAAAAPNAREGCEKLIRRKASAAYAAALFFLCMICMTRVSPFIYFNF